jgi:hypothetical protein
MVRRFRDARTSLVVAAFAAGVLLTGCTGQSGHGQGGEGGGTSVAPTGTAPSHNAPSDTAPVRTVLADARRDLAEETTARLTMTVEDGRSLGFFPAPVGVTGVMDMVNLTMNATYDFKVSTDGVFESRILPSGVYTKLPKPEDGKHWAQSQYKTVVPLRMRLDREYYTKQLEAFAGELKGSATVKDGEELTKTSATVDIEAVLKVTGGGANAKDASVFREIGIKTFGVSVWQDKDRRTVKIGFDYEGKMAIELSDFGAPVGDVSEPDSDDVIEKLTGQA